MKGIKVLHFITHEQIIEFLYGGMDMNKSTAQGIGGHRSIIKDLKYLAAGSLCRDIIQNMHHRRITNQVEIMHSFYGRLSMISDNDTIECNKKYMTNNGFIASMLSAPMTAYNRKALDNGTMHIHVDAKMMDIILNYPMLHPLIAHNLFVLNGVAVLSNSWQDNAIGVLEDMSAELQHNTGHIAEITAILRYGTSEHDISEAFHTMMHRSFHVNTEYYAPRHICNGMSAMDIMHDIHDHVTAMRMIRRKSHRGYIQWDTAMDIAAHHDNDMMSLLAVYDDVLGIHDRKPEAEYPSWVGDYIIYSHLHHRKMMIPTRVFTMDGLKDMEDYPYEFNYVNIEMNACESWMPTSILSVISKHMQRFHHRNQSR